MLDPYFKKALAESLGNISREVRVALTPEPRSRRWAFIVGCYNSGTTLLAELLGRHAEISSLPVEGQFITDQFVKDYEVGLSRMWSEREELFRLTENDEGPDVQRIKRQWAMRLDRSRPVLLEKSPPNSARTRWLARHFDPASFIVMVRDGYAVAEGIRRKARPKHLREGWPLEKCARQWRRTYELLEADLAGVDRVLWVRYEDLVDRPEGELRRIAGFLGVDTDFAIDRSAAVRVHEREEPLHNLNRASIARLTDADMAVISRIAGDYLAKYGYLRPPAEASRSNGAAMAAKADMAAGRGPG